MFALPISMPRFKSINFYQNIPKIKLFLQKIAKFFMCWRLRPRPLFLQRLGALLPGPQNIPAIANFWLRVWCFHCCYVILCKLILWLAGVYGFPQVAIFLNKFAHPCA